MSYKGYVDADTLYPSTTLSAKQKEIRQLAINNLEAFIRLVAPYQLLAPCHIELLSWIARHDNEHRLVLWPRDHGKSRLAAFYATWQMVRDPATTIIYASATAEKAEEQLRFIKSILDSTITARYFPGLIDPAEGRRAAWNVTSIIVDHPLRKTEGVVDSTIMTCGLEKTITGKHCKRLILDDIVVPENNTEQGRKDVNSWVAQAASITSADSTILGIGTRYHPKDAYSICISMVYQAELTDESGETSIEPTPLFIVNQANVERDGDFLWPRIQRKTDGKWFGFNTQILSKKRAVYEAAGQITQFYAQYYNDPNDKSTSPIARDLFKYYDRALLEYSFGTWNIGPNPLSIYASVDLAASTQDRADYTVLMVGGLDTANNRYVMDIIRLKTEKISVIYAEIEKLYKKYHFKKLRIEAVAGFRMVAQDLADTLFEKGIRIPIDLYIPPRTEAKFVRINNILEPLYQSGAIYHYRGGNCQVLEDELCQIAPENDDTKDAWAMCIDIMVLPLKKSKSRPNVLQFHPRFGGINV